ncbi:hypothetical protein [Mammaliicoccus sp. R-M65]|nr:hypothetical protein [Mammaliicoccus sp. R-M65]
MNIALYQLLSDWNPMEFENQSLEDSEVYDCKHAINIRNRKC